MSMKIAIISIISMLFYAYILICFGVVGPYFQNICLTLGFYILKYGLITFGLFLCCFLPYRVDVALKKRAKAKYDIESNRKIDEAAKQKKALEEKIMKEYIKGEDAI